MNLKITKKSGRRYLHQTGALGVWIPEMEPTATAGEFYQPHSGWTWSGAELYVLPSGKIVHHQGNWSAIQGRSDSQTVTVFSDAAAALKACEISEDASYGGPDDRPEYLTELLESAGVIETLLTLE